MLVGICLSDGCWTAQIQDFLYATFVLNAEEQFLTLNRAVAHSIKKVGRTDRYATNVVAVFIDNLVNFHRYYDFVPYARI